MFGALRYATVSWTASLWRLYVCSTYNKHAQDTLTHTHVPNDVQLNFMFSIFFLSLALALARLFIAFAIIYFLSFYFYISFFQFNFSFCRSSKIIEWPQQMAISFAAFGRFHCVEMVKRYAIFLLKYFTLNKNKSTKIWFSNDSIHVYLRPQSWSTFSQEFESAFLDRHWWKRCWNNTKEMQLVWLGNITDVGPKEQKKKIYWRVTIILFFFFVSFGDLKLKFNKTFFTKETKKRKVTRDEWKI